MANTARVTQSALELLTSQSGTVQITQDAIEFVVGAGVDCGDPPIGHVGQGYDHTFPSGGGTPPYTFSITAGALPPGLTLNTSTGEVTGAPSSAGIFTFTITIVDSMGTTSSVTCSITVTGIGSGGGGVPVTGCGCCPPLPKAPFKRPKRKTEWPTPPPGSEHFDKYGSVNGPATSDPVVLCEYQVPNNCRAQLTGVVALPTLITNWDPGDGNVEFSILIDRTPGLANSQGYALSQMGNLTAPLGDLHCPWPIPDCDRIVLESRWIVRLTVATNPLTITPGDMTRFLGILHGWEWGIGPTGV